MTISGQQKRVSKLGGNYYSQNTASYFEMQGSKEAYVYSTSSGIGIVGETPNSTQILTESVNAQGADFKMMEILSGLGDEQLSKRVHSELQNLVDKLREDFANELEERDTVILLYKNLWTESEAALASIKCEVKHIKAELEALKQRQLDKDAHDLSVGDCETSENRGRANCLCSLQLSLSPEENILDQAAIQLSQGHDAEGPDTKPNLNSLMNVTPQAHAKGTFCERAAILFSRDKSLGCDASDNWGRTNSKNTLEVSLNLKDDMMDEDAMLLSQERNHEDLDSKTNLNSPVNVAPEVFAKGNISERAAILFSPDQSLGEGETSENSGCQTSLEFNLNPNENIMDKGAMLLSLGKDHAYLDIKTNLNSPVSVTPQAHAKGTLWEQEATISQDTSLIDGEIAENLGRANCETSLENNLNPKENIMGEGTMLASQGNNRKDLNTNTNLISPWNVTPQANTEGTFLERAAILFSRDRSHGEGETSENRGRENCKNSQEANFIPKEIMTDEGARLLSQGKDWKDLYTKANLNSPVNVTPQAHARETFLERAAILFSRDKSLGEGEISGNWGRANCKTSLDMNLNPKQNIMGDGAMLLSQGKTHMDLDTKTTMSSPVNVTPQTHGIGEGTVLERAAILFSRDKSLGEGETFDNKGRANCKNPQGVNLNPPEETWDISKSAYDTEEFSNSYLRPKIPSTFHMERFLDLVPETDCSSEEDELIGTLGLKGQLEASSSLLSDDLVCSQSQCFYHGVQLEESNSGSDPMKLIDASTTENSGKKRKCGNAIIMEDLSQILFANSFTINKREPEEGNVSIRINSERCNNPPKGGADVEYLNEKEVGFISHCKHDSDCIIVANEEESSSTKSESSWEHIEVEENISTAMNTSTFLV